MSEKYWVAAEEAEQIRLAAEQAVCDFQADNETSSLNARKEFARLTFIQKLMILETKYFDDRKYVIEKDVECQIDRE